MTRSNTAQKSLTIPIGFVESSHSRLDDRHLRWLVVVITTSDLLMGLKGERTTAHRRPEYALSTRRKGPATAKIVASHTSRIPTDLTKRELLGQRRLRNKSKLNCTTTRGRSFLVKATRPQTLTA